MPTLLVSFCKPAGRNRMDVEDGQWRPFDLINDRRTDSTRSVKYFALFGPHGSTPSEKTQAAITNKGKKKKREKESYISLGSANRAIKMFGYEAAGQRKRKKKREGATDFFLTTPKDHHRVCRHCRNQYLY